MHLFVMWASDKSLVSKNNPIFGEKCGFGPKTPTIWCHMTGRFRLGHRLQHTSRRFLQQLIPVGGNGQQICQHTTFATLAFASLCSDLQTFTFLLVPAAAISSKADQTLFNPPPLNNPAPEAPPGDEAAAAAPGHAEAPSASCRGGSRRDR